MKKILNTLLLVTLYATPSNPLFAADIATKSKRIKVYANSQSFWDVKPGDTLSEIAKQLLPQHRTARANLQKNILTSNPNAFIKNNPNKLKANVRLWFSHNTSSIYPNKHKYNTTSFSWGKIHRQK